MDTRDMQRGEVEVEGTAVYAGEKLALRFLTRFLTRLSCLVDSCNDINKSFFG